MRLNRRGQAVLGIGDGTVSIDGKVITKGGGACWLTDDTILYQTTHGAKYVLESTRQDGVKTLVSEQGANELAAGGGVWAAWGPSGVRDSLGRSFPKAGLLDVSREGVIAICPDRQSGRGARLLTPTPVDVPECVASGVRLVGSRLVWIRSGKVQSNQGAPVTIAAPNYSPVPVQVGAAWWLLYQDGNRLLLQPWHEPVGYIVHDKPETFSPDAVLLPNGQIRVAWSVTQGEGPTALRVRDIDISAKRVDLSRPVVVTPPPPPPPHPPPPMPTPMTPPALRDITWLHANVRDWPETSRVTRIQFTKDSIVLEFDKVKSWPDLGGGIGNPWIVAYVNGKWYAATYEWLRPGQTEKFVTAETIGAHTKKAPLATWKPKAGELVGFFASTFARDDRRTTNERTNIAWVKWGESQSFSAPAPVPDPEPPTPPVDPPKPPPPPSPPPSPDVSALTARLDALERRCAILTEDLMAETAARVALASRLQNLRVKGSTSKVWGHGHDIDLNIEG